MTKVQKLGWFLLGFNLALLPINVALHMYGMCALNLVGTALAFNMTEEINGNR